MILFKGNQIIFKCIDKQLQQRTAAIVGKCIKIMYRRVAKRPNENDHATQKASTSTVVLSREAWSSYRRSPYEASLRGL